MRLSRLAVVFLGVLWVAGCAEQAAISPPPPPEQPVEPPAKPPEEITPQLIPPVPPPKPPIPQRPVPEKVPLPTPAELVGLDHDGVIKLLGDPADNHTEGAARVFTYRGKNCQLDVIFFFDIKTGMERVLSYEQQPDSGKHAATCYPSLRGTR